MITHQSGVLPGGVKRGDVGIAEQGLGVALQQIDRQSRQQSRRAVSSAQTPDAVDPVVLQRVDEIIATLTIVSGEISRASQRVLPHLHRPPQRLGRRHGALELMRSLQRPGRRDHRDARANDQRRWRLERAPMIRASGIRPGKIESISSRGHV